MSGAVTVTRRLSMYRASDLARTVAAGVAEYGSVTVTQEAADWLLTAPVEFISARDLFGPTVAEERAAEAEERRVTAIRAALQRRRAA